jgi:MFS family permease
VGVPCLPDYQVERNETGVPMDVVLLVAFVFAYMAGLTVLAGWLADRKGYSFVLFAVLGLFLGIFAVLIAAVMPSKKLAPADT